MELETFFSVDTQVEVFLLSCLVGVALGVIYDAVRILRIVLPHNDVLVAIEDVLLLACYGTFLMCFAFSLMRGQIRFFFVVGNLLGFAVWYFTVGSVINRVAYRVRKYVLIVAHWVGSTYGAIVSLLKSFKKKSKKYTKTLD